MRFPLELTVVPLFGPNGKIGIIPNVGGLSQVPKSPPIIMSRIEFNHGTDIWL